MSPRLRLALLAALLALLAACTTTPPTTTPPAPGEPLPPGDSRYAAERDSAPLRPISAEDVRDAVPRPDPVLAFGNATPYSVNGVTYEILEEYRNYREQGIASWYGAKFDGYATSNGETYDIYQPSAAHKTLPIPSYARVTNLENGNSVIVRVNDRGPFYTGRLIDLSYAAAVKLGYMETGTARVEVEVIDVVGVDDRRDDPLSSYRYLQLGAFGEDTARRLQGELQPLLSAPVFIAPVDAGGNTLFRVRVGPVEDSKQLLAVQQKLQDSGYDRGQPLP